MVTASEMLHSLGLSPVGASSEDLWYQAWQIALTHQDPMPCSFPWQNYGLCTVLNQHPQGQEFLDQIYIWMVDCTVMNWTDKLDATVINQLYAQSLPVAQPGLRTLANHFIRLLQSTLASLPSCDLVTEKGDTCLRPSVTTGLRKCSGSGFIQYNASLNILSFL